MCDRLVVPVASLIVLVSEISVARNSMLLVMFSQRIGQMLADEGVIEAELVGEDDGLAILLQRLRPAPVHRMHRHREVAQSHGLDALLC